MIQICFWNKIGQGARQGCCFSPVIFIHALKLLTTIKNNVAMKGIQIRENQFKTFLIKWQNLTSALHLQDLISEFF